MISTRFSRWSTRLLLFACAFAVLFFIGLVFAPEGYHLFVGMLEESMWALAVATVAVYLVEAVAARFRGHSEMFRAVRLIFPPEHVALDSLEVTRTDLDNLRLLVHDFVLAATGVFVVLAIVAILYAVSIVDNGAWIFLAVLCIALVPTLWLYRYERLRRIDAAAAVLFGPDGDD
ncbi:hypothetical protein [Nocardia terpenica]|uniref:hypothetical protein n=1 Tax=Nocardia terpenica TaxID=455432 RepID=UPI00142DACE9|nr:hypothetical protein [Nocardia terpenica]